MANPMTVPNVPLSDSSLELDLADQDMPSEQPGHAYRPNTPWKPLSAVGMTSVVMIVAVLVGSVFGALTLLATGMAVPGSDVIAGQKPSPEALIGAMLPAMLISQIVMTGLTWLLASQQRGQPLAVLSLWMPRGSLISWLLIIAGFIAASYSLGLAINVLSGATGAEDSEKLLPIVKTPMWPLALLVVTLGAAVSEEVLFRGFLFSALAQSRLGIVGASVITSALWAVIHFYSWQGVLTIFGMGLILSYILTRTGSVWVTIACHAAFNACSFAVMVAIANNPTI
jgi:uncharacterized protein